MAGVKISGNFALLCEGKADQKFFAKLIEKRGAIPDFLMLPHADFYGKDDYTRQLLALKGDPSGFAALRGVLIVVDSADCPKATFRDVCRQIQNAGGYGVPTRPLEIAPAAGHPAVAVMPIPDERTPGGLEVLCTNYFEAREPWVTACLKAYLECGEIKTLSWSPEKIAKARYQCLVAALHEADPSRALSMAFKSGKNARRRMIHVEDATFDQVYNNLRGFCDQVNGFYAGA